MYNGLFVNWSRKIVVYPKGDRTDRHVSIYLEVADAATLPDGWCRDVRFRFALVDQYNGADSMAMCEYKISCLLVQCRFPFYTREFT